MPLDESSDNGFREKRMLRQQTVRNIFDTFVSELERAEKKHPQWPTDPLRQTAVVVEEAGEALQATLNLVEYREIMEPSDYAPINQVLYRDTVDEHQRQIDKEMVETGAMALRYLLNRRLNP